MKTFYVKPDGPFGRQRRTARWRWPAGARLTPVLLAPVLLASALVATPLVLPSPSVQALQVAATASPMAAPELHFPVLEGRAGASSIHVQSLGSRLSGVMLVLFPSGTTDWTTAPPPAPSTILCRKGAPGAAVTFAADEIPAREMSGVAFSLSTMKSAAGGPFGESAYDLACGAMGRSLVGDAVAYQTFKRSFEGDGTWMGLPWSQGMGNPLSGFVRMATQAQRAVRAQALIGGSPARVRPGAQPIVPLAFAPRQLITQTVTTYTLPLLAPKEPLITQRVTLQNAGNTTLRVTVWLHESGRSRAPLCDGGYSLGLPPAATQTLCLKPLAVDGTLILQAMGEEPARLAISVEMDTGRHVVTAGFDGDLALAANLALPMPFALPADGTAQVQLVNPSAGDALVEVSWEDGKGGDVLRRRHSLKQWETVTVDLGGSPIPVLPTQGLVRVRSLSQSSGARTADGPPVSAVLLLRTTTSVSRAPEITGLVAEPFRAVGADGAAERGGLIAVPLLQNTEDGISEVSLLDAAEGDGFTDLRLAIQDANGLLDFDCVRVDHGRVHVWDLRNIGTLPTGFRGSGIISAEYWEHARPAPAGAPEGADLIASIAMRSRDGELPVEPAAESLARYLAASVSDPILPLLPPCPGVPTRIPPATSTPVPTATMTPSATPVASSTPLVSQTWTASPSPTQSATPTRPRLFLPAVLAGADPWPLGLVLVVDVLPRASLTSPLHRGEPAAIPLPAARRLGLVALDLLRPREDSAALVQFDAAAQVLSRGRAADVATALRALAEVDLTATARPDLGLAAAELALRDLRSASGAQRGAVLLFVDGATAQYVFEKAVYRAGGLRAGGVPLYALGFRRVATADIALERLTDSPQQVHWVGDSEAALSAAGKAVERWAAEGWRGAGSIASPVGLRNPRRGGSAGHLDTTHARPHDPAGSPSADVNPGRVRPVEPSCSVRHHAKAFRSSLISTKPSGSAVIS